MQFIPNRLFPDNEGLFPHNKVLIVANEDYTVDDDSLIYIGSHNLSNSAWGQEGNEGDYAGRHVGTNTEMGVVYPSKTGSGPMKRKILESLSFSMNPKDFKINRSPYFSKTTF